MKLYLWININSQERVNGNQGYEATEVSDIVKNIVAKFDSFGSECGSYIFIKHMQQNLMSVPQ